MTLRDWLRWGRLSSHRASKREISDLLALIDRDLAQCQTGGLAADWQLAIAYNAALQCAITALAAEGYRPRREDQHYQAIQSLALTLGWDDERVSILDAFRGKRHAVGYERAGAVSDREAEEMISLAQALRRELHAWLEANHSELL
jgi:hypothetical protein